MKIPGLNLHIVTTTRFEWVIRDAAEKARAEHRQLTNALVTKLIRENIRLRTK
jgi:hypothetical protein